MNLNSIVSTVLLITFAGLILKNASAFNGLMRTGGGLVTENLALLQGNTAADVSKLAPSSTGLGLFGF